MKMPTRRPIIIFKTGFVIAVLVGLSSLATGRKTETPTITLNDVAAGNVKIIDLGYSLNSKNAFWPGDNYKPFELKTIATIEKDGVLSKTMSLPEHLGTHIDAPNHFESNQPDVSQISPYQLFGPGVVIDVKMQVELSADYELSVADIRAWEKKHGPIPTGAIVLLNTGWGRFWDNIPRFQNKDVKGKLHFPGFSGAAAKFLVQQRNVRGIGIDTLSIDHGISKDFAVHHTINAAQKFGLENVAQLDKLPPSGFFCQWPP